MSSIFSTQTQLSNELSNQLSKKPSAKQYLLPPLLRQLHSTTDSHIDGQIWVAAVCIQHISDHTLISSNHLDTKNKYQQHRLSVRLLLAELLDQLNIIDTLCEQAFPYYLNESGYYVCFSHSNGMVAVALSTKRIVGVDIEVRDVQPKISQRYYHDNELELLAVLSQQQQQLLINELWRIKECIIKVKKGQLTSGMGVDLSCLIPSLVQFLGKPATIKPWQVTVSESEDLAQILEYNVSSLWVEPAYRLTVAY